MENSSPVKSVKHARNHSISEEQTLCLEAMESGAYDDMTDQEWVALCERLAADARQHDELVEDTDHTLAVVGDLIKPHSK